MGDADEADVVAGRIPARLGFGAQPPPFAVGALIAGLQHERLERGLAGDQFLHDPLLVVRMQPLAPVEHDGFLERQPEEIEIGLVGEGTRAVELGDPDRHRRAVGDQAEALLAFAQGRLRQHLRGDVAIGADQAQRAAVAVALDLGDDADPADRAVIRPHDAVFGRIVLALALQHAEQMLDRSLAILGMDSADPFLVGFVGRLGRQAVNQQIFGGAAVLDAVAEIDFETADAGDALDSRQLRLAFLQGAMSLVALVRDFLQMLPQAFGGGNFRQDVRSVRMGHARQQPLLVLSHRKRRLCQLHLLLVG